MTTATYESLYIERKDPSDLFEKQASIARMPDDDRKWPETVLSELHKQLPFMSGMDVSLNFTRIQPEAGYGFGYALVRGEKNAVGLAAPKSESDMVKIPIVVADRHLEPFHVFNYQGRTIPLTQKRFEEALENPRVFAGPASTPKTSKSLIDQLYPPYQQRQGFGRVVDGAGMTGASMGINKTAQDITKLKAKDLKQLAELKAFEGIDKSKKSMSKEDQVRNAAGNAAFSAGAGAAVGGIKGIASKGKKLTLAEAGRRAGSGAAMGALISGANYARKKHQSKKRDKARRSAKYRQFFNKEATILAPYSKYLMGAKNDD